MSLKPIINNNTDILFIPLNPAPISDDFSHYFSHNKVFWLSLQRSKLISATIQYVEEYSNLKKKDLPILKIENNFADVAAFKKNTYNYKELIFSIRDLAPDIVHAKSEKVRITTNHCSQLLEVIKSLEPKFAVIMHSKVRNELFKYLKSTEIDKENSVFQIVSKENVYFNFKEQESTNENREELSKKMSRFGDSNGPYGKIIKNLDTLFFSIPFPSTQNGSQAENEEYWKSLKKYIDDNLAIKNVGDQSKENDAPDSSSAHSK